MEHHQQAWILYADSRQYHQGSSFCRKHILPRMVLELIDRTSLVPAIVGKDNHIKERRGYLSRNQLDYHNVASKFLKLYINFRFFSMIAY